MNLSESKQLEEWQERAQAWESLTEAEKDLRNAEWREVELRNQRLRQATIARELWGRSNAPPRHAACDVSRDGDKLIWSQKLETVRRLVFSATGPLIGLTGNRGNGKTQLAIEIMREAANAGHPVLFTSAIGFFAEIKATYRSDSTLSEIDVLKKFLKPWILVIDEVGKRGGSDWENNLIFELLNRRYNAVLSSILIDNRSHSEFIEWIGPSLADRMNEGGGIIECNWPSFRK